MEQDINQTSSRRFIFSDDFYDQLEVETPKQDEVSFDIPKMPPQVETVKKETISEKPVDFSFDIKPITEEKIEEKEEIPTFNFKKEEEQIINEPISIENSIFVQEKDNQPKPPEDVLIPKVEENLDNNDELKTVPTLDNENQNNDKYNISTGINTDLEQEIMKTRFEPKIDIVQNNSNVWLEPKEEKQYYRATRNTNFNNNNISPNLNSEIPIKQEENKVEKPTITNQFKQSDIIITEKDIKPPIINIEEELQKEIELEEELNSKMPIIIEENNDVNSPVTKSNLLNELRQKELQTGKISILARYGEDFCSRDYVTNPAIGRSEEIKQLILILLTPEKSGILVGKPGIGKTSIVEGLAYRLQRNQVPEALRGYRIVSVKTTSLLGTLPTGETRLQTLIDELKDLDKIILFIDEIHMLMGATSESSLDFANMFKESLGRGSIKMIGATTDDEYERYVLRDKAFVRRFQRVDVLEPTRDQTIRILVGTLPKIEKNTGAKLKYTNFIQTEILSFIVDITSEYKRIYGIGSRYPDICLTLLSQAFSQAVFNNRKEVTILDIRNAIENSKNIYPDVIRKELVNFDNKFKKFIDQEKAM